MKIRGNLLIGGKFTIGLLSIIAMPVIAHKETPLGSPSSSVKHVVDLLNGKTNKRCTLQIDSSNIPCNVAWYIEFKHDSYAVQFNKGADNKARVSFFGSLADPDTITIEAVGYGEDEHKAKGQCLLGTTTAQCQAPPD